LLSRLIKMLRGTENLEIHPYDRESEKPGKRNQDMYKKITDVSAVLLESVAAPVLVLKHSIACPFSGSAKREVDKFLEAHPEAEVYLVVVQEQRPVSNELAERLGVRHETPQLLLLRDGRAERVWSHGAIEREEIAGALEKN